MRLIRPAMTYASEIMAYRTESLEVDPEIPGSSELPDFESPAEWIAHCESLTDSATLPPDHVEADEWMMVDDDSRIAGVINIRHHIDHPYLAEWGGHIGYSIRPGERGRGYAKVQLTLALDKCRDLGLDRVLLTCDLGNEPSRRTILSCGGVFERMTVIGPEHPGPMERYWITL